MPTATTSQRPAGLAARLVAALKDALRPSARPNAPESSFTPAGPADQPPARPENPGHQRHHEALAVLTAARGVVERGWLQRAWFVTEVPAGRRRVAQRFFPGRLEHANVVDACLVGAVIHAAWQQSARPEYAYPAIDALWHTLLDPSSPLGADPVGPLCPPMVRAARVRDLTTWNDRDYRTKDDVLRLLDRAAARISEARPRSDAYSRGTDA